MRVSGNDEAQYGISFYSDAIMQHLEHPCHHLALVLPDLLV